MWGRTIWYNNCTRRAARSNSRPRVGANPWRGSRNGRTAYFNSRPRVGANVRYLPDMLASFWLQLTPPYRGESNLISAESMLCPTPTHAPWGGANAHEGALAHAGAGATTPAPVWGANSPASPAYAILSLLQLTPNVGANFSLGTPFWRCVGFNSRPRVGANFTHSFLTLSYPFASTHAPVWGVRL